MFTPTHTMQTGPTDDPKVMPGAIKLLAEVRKHSTPGFRVGVDSTGQEWHGEAKRFKRLPAQGMLPLAGPQ